MLSLFRSSRICSNQLSNNRRQLCVFTSIFSIPSNVNHEETRKFSICASLSLKYHSIPFKKLFNTVIWTRQIYALQSFSSNSGSERFDKSRYSERDTRTVMVAGLSKDTTVESLRQYFIEKKWDVTDCSIVRDKETGISRKFGFVEFATVEQAQLASKDRTFIDDKNVSVRMKGNKELDEKYRIFVGGLPTQTTQATLHRYFSEFGDIFECHIVRDDDNLSKGFGFVIFKDQKSIDRTLNSQPHSIFDQVLTVKHALPRRRELTMFIGNLSLKTNDESLRKHFSKYGKMTQCNVKIDRQTGQSRGFGYVAFGSQEELDRALRDQPHVIDGIKVKLDYQTSELVLVVNCLPRDISEESLERSLWDFFSDYGRVRECRIIKNSAGTTTAFVSMSSKDEISRALNARPHLIDGKHMIDTRHQGAEFALIVHGLPKDATDEDLRKTFSEAGKLVHWQVMRAWKDKTNRSLGYGYVKYSTAEDVARAIEKQPYEINGTKLKIERKYDIYKTEK